MLDVALFKSYVGLIFDMDGTLLDTMPSHAKAWRLVGEHFGYALDGDLIYALGGAPAQVIAQTMMAQAKMPLSLIDEVIILKRQFAKSLLLQHTTLLPAVEVIYAYTNIKPMALGTGSHREMTQLLLQQFDLEKYFTATVTSEDVEKHKPAPDTFLRCADLIQVKPQDCVVFEDADLGVQAGLAAGMMVFDVRINQFVRTK